MRYLIIVLMTLTACNSADLTTSAVAEAAQGPAGPQGPQGIPGQNASVSSWFSCNKTFNTGMTIITVSYKVVRFSNGDTFVKCGIRLPYGPTISDYMPGTSGDTASCSGPLVDVSTPPAQLTFTTVGATRNINIAPVQYAVQWINNVQFASNECVSN